MKRAGSHFLYSFTAGLAWLLGISGLAGGETNQTSLPVDLPAVLRLAGAQNLDVQIARERVAQAEAAEEGARLQYFPWLSPGIGYRRHQDRIQDVVGNIINADKQSLSPGAAFSAQVDFGDAIYKNLAARQFTRAAREAMEAQSQDTILAAAFGYLDLSRGVAAIGIAREAERISRAYEDQLHAAVEAGLAFKGDELRVRLQTERYVIAVRQAQESTRITASRLAQMLRIDPAVELVPQESDPLPMILVATNASLPTLIQQGLAMRSELRQSRALVEAANAGRRGAEYGPLIPSIGAQAFLGGLTGGTGNNLDHFGPTEDLAVGLGWRIGPGGIFDRSRTRAAESRLAETRLTDQKIHDQVVQQIVEAWARVKSLAEQVGVVQASLATAAETAQLTGQRREYSVGVVLEAIQAQQDLTRSRQDYLQTVAEFDKSQFAIQRALGGSGSSGGAQAGKP